MNNSQFKKYQFKKFCLAIQRQPDRLQKIIDTLEIRYIEWTEQKFKASGELKTFKDGTVKERQFMAPKFNLKAIQAAINTNILSALSFPQNVHGGVKKKNNITNAISHKGKKYRFYTDLQDFYPNINNDTVFKTLLSAKFNQHWAYWITLLCTRKYQLPQGAPTSNSLANLAFTSTDTRLISFSIKNNLTYTRYVDDITISSPTDFRDLTVEIINIITEGGFKVNYRKTKYGIDDTITGIKVFNNLIDAPKRIKDLVKQENIDSTESKPYTDYFNRIRKANV
jgi:RNA-directed DNA polymerase